MSLDFVSRLMSVTARPPLVMARGEGSYLWDEAGRRYLDFVQGWAVNALGHSPPELVRALCAQAATLLNPSPAFHNANQLRLAERLTTRAGMAQAYFCSTGAEANELAVKIARKWGKARHRGQIVTTRNGFHGRTLAMMAASGKPGWSTLFPPAVPGFVHVDYGDIVAMKRALSSDTVGILLEPIQGEAGVVVPPSGYLRDVRQLADERDLLLLLDEVQTGMSRTGTLFGFEQEGIAPDVLTLGKGLGGGVPLSATLVNERAACLALGDQGGTFNGNPLATAAGLAMLEVVSQPPFLERVQAAGSRMGAGLMRLAQAGGGKVRGRGLLWAWELPMDTAERARDICLERGLLLNAARPNVLRFMPSLRVSDAEIECMLAVLGDAMKESTFSR